MQSLRTGEIIRGLRKNKKITQEELAEVLGLSTAAISKWESGVTYPDIQIFPILARYFHVSIDYLMDFSSTISQEERDQIYREIASLIKDGLYDKVIESYTYYTRQYVNDLTLKYNLANIMASNMTSMAEKGSQFINSTIYKLIRTYEQCLESDDLTIKQGAYYQIGNLYIALQNYDEAQNALSQIPAQGVNPHLLLNMISVNKGDYLSSQKNIQSDVLKAINEILGELSLLIRIYQNRQDWDNAISLFRLQLNFLNVFELTPFLGAGSVLQLANALCEVGKIDEAVYEMKRFLQFAEERKERKTISEIPLFFHVGNDDIVFMKEGATSSYKVLLDRISIRLSHVGEVDIIQRFSEFFGIQ